MKCKLNDLCFVIKADVISNLGKVVTCTEYLGYLSNGKHYWQSKVIGLCDFWVSEVGHYWIVEGNLTNNDGVKLPILAMSERELLPIKGEPLEDFEISCKELETI